MKQSIGNPTKKRATAKKRPSAIKFSNETLSAVTPRAERFELRDTEERGLRLRVTPAGAKTFGLFYRRADGALVRYTIGRFGDLTVKQARDEAKRIKGQAKRTDTEDPATAKKERRLEGQRRQRISTLRKLLTGEFQSYIETEQRSGAATVHRIAAVFPDLLDKPLTDITRWTLRKWAKDRKDAGRSVFTIDRDLAALSTLFTFAASAGLVTVNPCRKPADEKRSTLRPRLDASQTPRYLSPTEEQQLRSALAARDKAMALERESVNRWRAVRAYEPKPQHGVYADHLTPMVLLVLNTGLRPGRELLELAWESIDFNAKTLTVTAATSKTGRSRSIKLNAEAVAVLTAWRKIRGKPGGLVFAAADGKARDNFKKAWAGVVKAAGLKDCVPYALRHTFATRLCMANVPLPVVQRLMGHQSITITMRYVHVNAIDLENAVAKLGAVP